MNEFFDFILMAVKIGLLIFCGNLLLALFSGTIFGSYFSVKKKFLKEVNDPKFMNYEEKNSND